MTREAWAEAHDIARELGVGYIGTDMLLLGLIRAGGVGGQMLSAAGATDEAVGRIVRQTNRSVEAPPEQLDPEHPRSTPATEHARGRSDGMATALGLRDGSVALPRWRGVGVGAVLAACDDPIGEVA